MIGGNERKLYVKSQFKYLGNGLEKWKKGRMEKRKCEWVILSAWQPV